MGYCSPKRIGILSWWVFLTLYSHKNFPTGKPLCLLSLVSILLVLSQLFLVLREIKAQGLGAVSWTGSHSWRGENRSVSCSALAKQLHEALLVLLRQLCFTVSWCRWAVEADPYLVILMYFTLYWFYYPFPPAPFPDYYFSSLEFIVVSPSAFVLLSSNNKVRKTDFIKQWVGNFLGGVADQTCTWSPINIWPFAEKRSGRESLQIHHGLGVYGAYLAGNEKAK